MDEIVFDASDFDSLARDMRRAASKFRDEVDVTLLEIGTELTAEAKALASVHSKTIAGTIKMVPSPGMITIKAGSEQVAIAALYELGNKGSKITDTTFRHPIFGRWDVQSSTNGNDPRVQKRYPFLRPALAADRRGVTKRMEATWDRALEPYRMKPEGI